jgi:hypothetical protein
MKCIPQLRTIEPWWKKPSHPPVSWTSRSEQTPNGNIYGLALTMRTTTQRRRFLRPIHPAKLWGFVISTTSSRLARLSAQCCPGQFTMYGAMKVFLKTFVRNWSSCQFNAKLTD